MTTQKVEIDLATRVQWRECGNSRYLSINFQHCTDEQRIAISDIALEIIRKEDLNSVRLLVDVNDTVVTIESMRIVRKDWQMMSPNLSKAAILGVNGFKSLLLKLWGNMMPFKTQPFATTEDAIDFLCKQGK